MTMPGHAHIVARVFPRRTRATPDDRLSFIGPPPAMFPPSVDEVHVSVTFSYDLPTAERLVVEWERVAPTMIGGPAFEAPGQDFVPGRYLRQGYVITSRGCPNHCWFCSVPRREGGIRELPIMSGWNVLDDNLLATSRQHQEQVFAMLATAGRSPEFTGGLEAARLTEWHAVQLRALRPKSVFFAYDTPDDLPHLRRAAEAMIEAGFTVSSHVLRCYVLCGYHRDTLAAAEARMRQVVRLGIMPMAMAYRDTEGHISSEWRSFQRVWARPTIIQARTTADVLCGRVDRHVLVLR